MEVEAAVWILFVLGSLLIALLWIAWTTQVWLTKMEIKLLDIDYRIQQLINKEKLIENFESVELPDDWWKRGEEPPLEV